MPKQKLGTGNKRAVLQRPGTSYTSPKAIKLRQRRAAALDYRLQGRAYHWIAKALGCHPSTAHDYVVKALSSMVPREKAEAVLQLELTRLDAMEGAIFREAAKGDIPSIDACLRIQHQRAKLLGLYSGEKGGSGVHVNVGGAVQTVNAEDVGIDVKFVGSHWYETEKAEEAARLAASEPKLIEHQPAREIASWRLPEHSGSEVAAQPTAQPQPTATAQPAPKRSSYRDDDNFGAGQSGAVPPSAFDSGKKHWMS
jgi:hypothetical protein